MTDAPKRIQVRWTKSGTGHVATPASAGLVANCAAQYLSTEALASSPEVAALIREAEDRGWNNGMLTATSIVAEERNKRNPGPLFEVLNKAVGKIEDTRFAAIRERKQ